MIHKKIVSNVSFPRATIVHSTGALTTGDPDHVSAHLQVLCNQPHHPLQSYGFAGLQTPRLLHFTLYTSHKPLLQKGLVLASLVALSQGWRTAR